MTIVKNLIVLLALAQITWTHSVNNDWIAKRDLEAGWAGGEASRHLEGKSPQKQ